MARSERFQGKEAWEILRAYEAVGRFMRLKGLATMARGEIIDMVARILYR